METINTDLIRRYCPGLAVHTHAQVAKHVVVDEQGCWPRDGSIGRAGYALVAVGSWDDGAISVHRYMCETLVGPIPYGHHVHHRCENRPCWHPMHLETVTPKEHKARHKHR